MQFSNREKQRLFAQLTSKMDEENAILLDKLTGYGDDVLSQIVAHVRSLDIEDIGELREALMIMPEGRLRLIILLAENALRNYVQRGCERDLMADEL